MSMSFYVAVIDKNTKKHEIPYKMNVLESFLYDKDGEYSGPNSAYRRELDVSFSNSNATYLLEMLDIKVENGVSEDIVLDNAFVEKLVEKLDVLFQNNQWDDFRRMSRIKELVIFGMYNYNAEVMYAA